MSPSLLRPRTRTLILCCLLAVFFEGVPARAQELLYDGNQNLPPYGGFAGGQFDTVSLQNGNLHLHIPIASWKQRGGGSVWLALEYDTATAIRTTTILTINHVRHWSTSLDFSRPQLNLRSNMGSWAVGSGIGSIECPGLGTAVNLYNTWVVGDPEGTGHPAELITSGDNCAGNTTQGPTADGSGIMVNIGTNPYLRLKDGTQIPLTEETAYSFVSSSGSTEDTNGNLMGPIDTLGRTLWTTTQGPNQVLTTPNGKQITNPGYTLYTVTDSTGTARNYRVDYAAIDVLTNFCGQWNNPPDFTCSEYNSPVAVPSKITLPNGATYLLSWLDSTPAELGSITLPTGATISYTYTSGCTQGPLLQGESSTTAPWDCRGAIVSRTESIGGSNNTWTYSGGTVTDPLGNQQVHVFTQLSINNVKSAGTVETNVSYYQGSASAGKLLKQVATAYTGEPNPIDGTLANIRPISVTTTLDNGLVSQKQTDYETFTFNGALATRTNPTEVREYDFGSGAPGALLRRTDYTYLHNSNSTYANLNIVDRPLTVTVYNGAGTIVSQTTNEYDNYTAGITPSGAVQHDSARGSSYTTRGNVTAIEKWRNTDGTWLTTRNQYDDSGNVLTQTDPLTHPTQFSYNDSWSSGGSSCAPGSGQTKAFLTQITNALNQTTKYSYFSCTGLEGSMTDPNNQPTTYIYDMLGRSTQVTYPDTGQTTYCYTDEGGSTCNASGPPYSVVTTEKMSSSQNLVSTDVFDTLGRPSQHQINSDIALDTILTTYDARGRVASVTNPYRPGDTVYGTSYSYDALNRTTQVTDADGSKATTSYTGNCATSTDEASKTKQSCTDGLGRVTQITENPGGLGYVTNYAFDAQNNLTSVVQNGSRTRTLVYNSLSELLSTTNPESGSTCFGTVSGGVCQQNGYDANGNLLYGTDARGILTTNAYDSLNRLTSKTYSDGTPTRTFVYDASSASGLTGLANTVGRLVAATNSNAQTVNSYDSRGRILNQWQCAPINCGTGGWFLFAYSFNMLGGQSSITYESFGCGSNCSDGEFTINQSFDGAGRANGLTSTINQPPLWPAALISGVTRNAVGEITEMQYGNGFTETRWYNSRLQPCRLNVNSSDTAITSCTATVPSGNVQDYSYKYNEGTADNGNVATWTATGIAGSTQTFNRSYAYDALNRLATMTAPGDTCSGASWSFDAWGNRTAQTPTGGTCPPWSQTYTTKNQIQGYSYDAAGNVLSDGTHSYAYDAENNITQVDGGATATYVFDALNQRVEKLAPSATYPKVYYWHDTDGHVRTQWDQAGVYMADYWYLDGEFMGQYSTQWTFKDHLGSARVILYYNKEIVDSMDYMPFGEQVAGGSATAYKFTGQERDPESNLDFFNARHYKNAFGSFMSPDPSVLSLADLSDPQQLNLYSYTRNNPLSFIDPTGLDCVYFNNAGTEAESIDHGSKLSECAGTGGDWVNGFVSFSGITYNSSQDTFLIKSFDNFNNYESIASAPGPQTQANNAEGFCPGDCTEAYSQTPYSDDRFAGFGSPAEQQRLSDLCRITGCPIYQSTLPLMPGGGASFAELAEEAESTYPKLAGKFDWHHIIPKYLGGAEDGELVQIPKAYHQLITNAFRSLAPYGQKVARTAEEVADIVKQVYTRYPLQ